MNEGNIFFELKGMEEIFWVAVHCRDLIWQRIGTKCRCWFRYVIIVNRLTTFIKHACFWPFLIHRDWGDRDCCIYIYIFAELLATDMLYWTVECCTGGTAGHRLWPEAACSHKDFKIAVAPEHKCHTDMNDDLQLSWAGLPGPAIRRGQ